MIAFCSLVGALMVGAKDEGSESAGEGLDTLPGIVKAGGEDDFFHNDWMSE